MRRPAINMQWSFHFLLGQRWQAVPWMPQPPLLSSSSISLRTPDATFFQSVNFDDFLTNARAPRPNVQQVN